MASDIHCVDTDWFLDRECAKLASLAMMLHELSFVSLNHTNNRKILIAADTCDSIDCRSSPSSWVSPITPSPTIIASVVLKYMKLELANGHSAS